MSRQEVEASIAAAEARNEAVFARLDERLQAFVRHTELMVAEMKADLRHTADFVHREAQDAKEAAQRAELSAQHADEAAQRASHASLAYFISLIAVGAGLYFGIRAANREMFEAYVNVTRAEVRAAAATFAGAERELDRQREEVIRLKVEADRKAAAPPPSPSGKQQ